MTSMVAFSDSTWPRTVLRPFCCEYSIIVLHQEPTDSVALKPRAHENRKFGALSACVIVQPHHAEHFLVTLVDGNEGRGAGRIVIDELVEQFVIHFAHRREKA
jgi:hypothetical protein